MKFLTRLLVLLFLAITFQETLCQEPVFPVTNYTTRNYGSDFHPQNTAVFQDNRGMIYAANGFKLLEFDGNSWTSYPLDRECWILSVTQGKDGRIYVGAQNEFGCYEPDKNGKLFYSSLSDSLDPAEMNFGNVWRVYSIGAKIIFQAEQLLFVYEEGKLHSVRPGTSFHTSFPVLGKLYVREREKGLMELRDTVLNYIEGSNIFDTTGIFFMTPVGKTAGKILIGTRDKGLWLFYPDSRGKKFVQLNSDFENGLKKKIITGATAVDENCIAVSTMNDGIVLIDSAGSLLSTINKTNGLNDNDVKQVITDSQGNLWAALNNGISMVNIHAPVSFYGEKAGLPGSVNAIARFRGNLFVGTNSGLFINDGRSGFKKINGFNGNITSLAEADGELFAASAEGIFRFSGNNLLAADNKSTYTLYYSAFQKLLLAGGPGGLRAFKVKPLLAEVNTFKIEGEDIVGVTSMQGTEKGEFIYWIGTWYNGVIRLTTGKGEGIEIERYKSSDGLPDGPVNPAQAGNEILFETLRGIYYFTDEETIRKTLPDSLKNKKEYSKGYFAFLADRYRHPGSAVSNLVTGQGKLWICSDNKAGYFDLTDSAKYISRPFNVIDAGKINRIYQENNGLCWIGSSDGLFRFNEKIPKNYDSDYNAHIRSASLIDSDSSIYSGAGNSNNNARVILLTGTEEMQVPVIKYSENSIRFEFSATFFESPDKTEFSFLLEGAGEKWSQWSRETSREFINLREGKYTLWIKARNVFGVESKKAGFSFVVLPPWYRSVWAYIAYIITGIILVWLIARLYSYRLKKENIRLEGIVQERTAEVVRQKDEISEKNTVLEHQKKEIEDSIRYASRIQRAVIPSENAIRQLLPESFVFFRPLSIVSGDFYWVGKVGSKTIYTAADCTGHGVPGAFMSMLGVAFLNEIVNKDNITSPDLVLGSLREKVIDALQQQGLTGETRDGMDISLVCLDTETGILEFAGAYNPLVMIRKGEITDFPGDKMPIGFYENMSPFTRHEIRVEKGDRFYMYSDGFEDQFGGPDGKKFKPKRLKCLFMEICNLPADKQREILGQRFDEWKGDLPQVDDVVVAGLAIH